MHGLTTGQRHKSDIGVMANALCIHRNHRLINETTQVGVEFRHDLPLLRFGGDVDHFNVRMRGEQPYSLRPSIARSSNDACLDLVHELSPSAILWRGFLERTRTIPHTFGVSRIVGL